MNHLKPEGNGFKTIITAYWYGTQYPDLPYMHNEEKPYTAGRQNSIIKTLLEKRYKVMIEPLAETIIIWISLYHFGQK